VRDETPCLGTRLSLCSSPFGSNLLSSSRDHGERFALITCCSGSTTRQAESLRERVWHDGPGVKSVGVVYVSSANPGVSMCLQSLCTHDSGLGVFLLLPLLAGIVNTDSHACMGALSAAG
jgi:hypothetical protein